MADLNNPDTASEPTATMSLPRWWICVENSLETKVLGPFYDQGLAFDVRQLLEFKNNPQTYWIVVQNPRSQERVIDLPSDDSMAPQSEFKAQ